MANATACTRPLSSRCSIASNSDCKIFRLKSDYPESFTNAVMMHLSFIMDLSGESLEEIMDNSCQHQKLGLFSSLKKRSIKETIFGVQPSHEVLSKLYPIFDYLGRTENCQREGIFRLSGNIERQKELKNILSNQKFCPDFDNSKFTLNDISSVLKIYLCELPEPLLLEKHFNAFDQIAEMKDESKQVQCIQLIIQLLPEANAILLLNMITLLNKVASQHKQSKMNAENLALIFTPHLLIPRKYPIAQLPETNEKLKIIVSNMINHAKIMFDYPDDWVTDVIRHSDEVQLASSSSRNKLPVKIITKRSRDEVDFSDEIVLNTVFSFTDRTASQAAAESTTTESALEELYSYIHTMPDSGKKRKLVKEIIASKTPVSNKSHITNSSLRKVMALRNIHNNDKTPIKKLFTDFDIENINPAILCDSFHLSEDENI